MTVALFIDANQYLTLYETSSVRKLLNSLQEQKSYIFVSTQIVDEVLRNKVRCAHRFFSDSFKEIGDFSIPVPDHLLNISDEVFRELRRTFKGAQNAREELSRIARDTLLRISRSEDDVSRRLQVLFDRSISARPEEIQRARERKEMGNPPGKSGNPLGDQIIWEQLLTYCRDNKTDRLWLVTNDADYSIGFGKDRILNSFLYHDLRRTCGTAMEIYCFNDLLNGITHFGRNANVKAEKLPTEQEAAEIRSEIENLDKKAAEIRKEIENIDSMRSRLRTYESILLKPYDDEFSRTHPESLGVK